MLKHGRRYTDEYCIIPVRFTTDNRAEFLEFLRETGANHGVSVVCLNRDMIAGFQHVETTLIHAIRSWNKEKGIARTLDVEVLLYAAGTRQTGQISPFGPVNGENFAYLCIIPLSEEAISILLSRMEEISGENWDRIPEEKKRRLMKFFDITQEELEVTGEDRLMDLICERSALLTINR